MEAIVTFTYKTPNFYFIKEKAEKYWLLVSMFCGEKLCSFHSLFIAFQNIKKYTDFHVKNFAEY